MAAGQQPGGTSPGPALAGPAGRELGGPDSPAAAAALGSARPRLGPVAKTCLRGKLPGTCQASLEWKAGTSRPPKALLPFGVRVP